MDIDTNALLAAYLKAFRARGGALLTEARAEQIAHAAGRWTVATPKGTFVAPVLVNAAGGWVQEVATLAGLPHHVTAALADTLDDVDDAEAFHQWRT